MADAEPALPLPPAPAAPAPAPEPAPLVAPAPEPAPLLAPVPWVKQEVNFHLCYKSSLAFRFGPLGFISTFLSFCLPICSLSTCFYV